MNKSFLKYSLNHALSFMSIISVLRMRQDDHHEFETSLSYLVHFRLAWAIEQDPVSKHNKNTH